MVNCIFHFDGNEEGVYHGGELVKGFAELTLEEPKGMRSLKLILSGDALAYYDHETRNRFTGKEIFFNSETVVFGEEKGPTIDLPAGVHRYNFEYQLPNDLPANFEYKHDFHESKAHIRYFVELKMDMKWKFDKEFKQEIKIVGKTDLNLRPELSYPCSIESSKMYCCLFCTSGPLTMDVWLARSGFVAGESIPIRVKFDNKSKKNISGVYARLDKILTMFSSKENSRIDLKKIAERQEVAHIYGEDGVDRASESVVYLNLPIPDTAEPSNDLHCKVLTVSYILRVDALGPCCSYDLSVTFPITIGSKAFASQKVRSIYPAIPSMYGSPQNDGYIPVPTMPPPAFNGTTPEDVKVGF